VWTRLIFFVDYFTTLFQYVDYIVSIVGWQVNDNEETRTNIHALSVMRTHCLSVQAIKAYASLGPAGFILFVYGPASDSCKQDSGPSGCVRGGEFLYLLSDCHLLKKVSNHGVSCSLSFLFDFWNDEIFLTHLTQHCHYFECTY
jgi:hypothetical protein